jgi:hypothetical protein
LFDKNLHFTRIPAIRFTTPAERYFGEQSPRNHYGKPLYNLRLIFLVNLPVTAVKATIPAPQAKSIFFTKTIPNMGNRPNTRAFRPGNIYQ